MKVSRIMFGMYQYMYTMFYDVQAIRIMAKITLMITFGSMKILLVFVSSKV